MNTQDRRLDSWKDIAEYLGRDVRTAMRWSKSHGLPVRRVAGGKGRSVFAFTSEIDAWLAGHPVLSEPPAAEAAPAVASDSPAERAGRLRLLSIAAAVAIVALGIVAAWSLARRSAADAADLRVVADATRVMISDGSGTQRELLRFDPETAVLSLRPSDIADINADGTPDVIVGVSYFEDPRRHTLRSGELMTVSPSGGLQWAFAFTDAVSFRGDRFTGPWMISDWIVGPAASPSRIAVASHHEMWWASIAAVLDHAGKRLSTFVNPGWIESVLWLDRDRLAVAGFNNARNAAMLAILNASVRESQAPGTSGTEFECVSCGGGAPLFYATFPRSEVNTVTASRFNRAQVHLVGDRIVVTTVEAGEPEQGKAATAIYEFDRQMRLLRAQYDDRYRDVHRQLELEGRLQHDQSTCADRDGPSAIDVWTSNGWRRVNAPR